MTREELIAWAAEELARREDEIFMGIRFNCGWDVDMKPYTIGTRIVWVDPHEIDSR